MNREIKFRAWSIANRAWVYFGLRDVPSWVHPAEVEQYTGLKDKNGDKEVYEGDIIDTEGNIIGNQYETPTLLERKSNLLVQGFGTKAWLTTYQEAVDRGCHDA